MKYLTWRERTKLPSVDNPKHMQMGDLVFDRDKCRQCGLCVLLCPGGGVRTEKYTKMDLMRGTGLRGKSGFPFLDCIRPGVNMCVACFDCGTACPEGAISIKRPFDAKYYYKRLSQTSDMRYPKRY